MTLLEKFSPFQLGACDTHILSDIDGLIPLFLKNLFYLVLFDIFLELNQNNFQEK